jgi:hypothetical protein
LAKDQNRNKEHHPNHFGLGKGGFKAISDEDSYQTGKDNTNDYPEEEVCVWLAFLYLAPVLGGLHFDI